MTGTALVLIARALHVVSSAVWAGFVMLIGFWFVGSNVADGPERSRWLRQGMVNRGARIVAPAAVVSLLSGLYLFNTLHRGTWSKAEFALGFGAIAAVMSFFVGAIGSGPAEKRLAQLDAAKARGESSRGALAEVAALERRVLITARLTAILLLASSVAMAVARYL